MTPKHDRGGIEFPGPRRRRIARRSLFAVAATALVAMAMLVPSTPAGAVPALPPGFTWTASPSGHGPGQLTDFAFVPAGGVLTTGKSGAVVFVAPDGSSRTIATLAVDDRSDIGLLGIDLANDYAVSGELYLFSTYATPTGSFVKVARWTVDDPADPSALLDETVVLDGITADEPVHAGGTVLVAPDDTLWISIGDGASPTYADPRSLRAQDWADPHGKVHHVYADGSGVPTNPFYDAGDPSGWTSRAYAAGFRSPFRMTLHPDTGVPYIGDVGWVSNEEVNVVHAGANYGWPCWEGSEETPGHRDHLACQALYDSPPPTLTEPVWSYPHALEPGFGAAVTGGIFYTGDAYPAEYHGSYFFGDYAKTRIWTLATNENDELTRAPESDDPGNPLRAFATDIGGPVRFRLGPGDDVHVADIYTGSIWRLRYAPGNREPVAVGTGAQPQPGDVTIAFTGDGSHDLDGDALTYSWDFGDGSPIVQTANPTHTYPEVAPPIAYDAQLTVTDPLGATGTTTVRVVPGNFAPELTLTAPPDAVFAVGDPVELSATVVDAEDGDIDDEMITWAEFLLHCPVGTCHTHPGATAAGSSFSTLFSDHGADTHMEIVASVTDAAGITTSETYVAQPEVHTLTVGSAPPGVVLEINETNTAAGSTFGMTAGSTNSVSAPLRFGDLVFTGWSDDGERTHTFVMPVNDHSLVANYAPAGLALEVTSSPTTGLAVGTDVTFQIALRLQADTEVPLSDVTLTHSACTPGPSSGDDGDDVLEPGETWTSSCVRELIPADLPYLEVTTGASGTTASGATFDTSTVSFVPSLTPIERHYLDLGGAGSFLGSPTGPEQVIAGGRQRTYQAGIIYWSEATGAHEVHGSILERYLALGGPSSFAGFPKTDELVVASGRRSVFEHAAIYWSPATGAREVHGSILDRYLSLGGPSSFVGFPVSDEEGVPGGARSRFQGAQIFWSEITGAREVHGSILDRYLSLGGPSSVLGFPVSDEEDVPGGRRSRFHGGEIYWSPFTGAYELHGSILGRYLSLGGASSFLGFPLTDEMITPDGVGRYNHFQGGSVYWSQLSGAHEVHGAIRYKWALLGWEQGFLGYPVTDEKATGGGAGRLSQFQGGSVYSSPTTGTHEVHGAIRDKWGSLLWEFGPLGLPVTDELTTPDGVGRYNHFQGGSVYWTPATGAHEVHGAIRDKWASMTWEQGFLGYPVSDELTTLDGVGRVSLFQGGSVYWHPATGAHEVHGAIRDTWASWFWEFGPLGYPVSDELTTIDGGGRFSRFQRGLILWWPDTGAFVP